MIWVKRLYIPALLVLVTVGVFCILKFGYEPAPVVIMTPSFFDTPEAIGAVILRRFYSPAVEHRLFAFGVPAQPEWHRHILKGFLLSAAQEKVPFEVIITEEQMPALDLTGLPPTQIVTIHTNSTTQSELIDALSAAKDKRTLLYLPSVFSTHVLKGNVVNRLEKMFEGLHILSITTSPLALRSDQEFLIDPPCLGSQRDMNGTAQLGCEALKAGRMHYRKKVKQERWVAIMNAPSTDDYLLMVSSPGQDKGTAAANDKFRMNPPAN